MSRSEQTKRIAGRIDVTYHRRPSWFRLWRRWVVLLTLVATGIFTAYAFVSGSTRGSAERWLNPGPVTLAHASFEHNCAACHDNNGRPGFSKVVSDTACLRCHDASPHAKGAAQFVSTDSAHSANCTACHVEHRGRATLVGSDDRLCSRCHENLATHLSPGHALDAGFAPRVTRFTAKDHPPFGRLLAAAGVALKPPTTAPVAPSSWLPTLHLKFNHAVHMDPHKVQATLACATCHVAVRNDRKSLVAVGSMQPVNYEHDCRSCHKLQFEKAGVMVVLPHASLDVARAPLLDLSSAVRQKLMTSASQLKAAMKDEPDEKPKGKDKDEPPPDPVAKAVADKTTELTDGFADSISAAYAKDVKRVKSDLKLKATDDRAEALDALADLAPKDRPALAEFIAANKSTTACAKCHEMAGDAELIFSLKTRWATLKPTTLPAPQPLHTVPTGVDKSPRRWFASSRFDHEAHRDQSCLSCHAGMDKDADDPFARLPALESCVACHHADTSAARGAGAACITCHDYHAR